MAQGQIGALQRGKVLCRFQQVAVGEAALLAEDGALNLKRLFKVRAGSYEAAADLTVITDGRTPDEIVKEITEKIK